jgi:hypothetical protein
LVIKKLGLVIKRKTLEEILADPEYGRRLEKAKNFKEAKKIIIEYCQKNQKKIKFIEL